MKPSLTSINFLVFLLILAFGVLVYFTPTENETEQDQPVFTDEMRDQEFIDHAFGDFITTDKTHVLSPNSSVMNIGMEPKDSIDLNGLTKELFESRKSNYEKAASKLVLLFNTLLVLMVIGVYILFYRPKEIQVPIINLTLPGTMFYIFIPIAISYFFFQFGLIQNAAIDSRIILELLTDRKEALGNEQIGYYYSSARNLVDQGFVDTWCTWYYDIFRGGRNHGEHHDVAGFMLYFFYGLFFGLAQVACIGLITTYYKLYKKKTYTSIALIICFTVFYGWSSGTIKWYPHATNFVAFIWLFTLLFFAAWVIYSKKKIQLKDL